MRRYVTVDGYIWDWDGYRHPIEFSIPTRAKTWESIARAIAKYMRYNVSFSSMQLLTIEVDGIVYAVTRPQNWNTAHMVRDYL